MRQYITVTSGVQNPSEFVSNFTDSINANDGHEIAVTSIFHGPMYNITDKNNYFTIGADTSSGGEQLGQLRTLTISSGYYETSIDVVNAMYKAMMSFYNSHEKNQGFLSRKPILTLDAQGLVVLKTNDNTKKFTTYGRFGVKGSLLSLLGVGSDTFKFTTANWEMVHTTEAGFLYSSIVTNSIIDQQKSRLLAILPIMAKPGYIHYEVTNPVYYDLSVHSFTDVSFTILDVKGKLVNIDPLDRLDDSNWAIRHPTILTLHIRPKKQ